MDDASLLAAYDEQLRSVAEMRSTLEYEQHGPLFWGKHRGGRGFVSYRSLGSATDAALERLIVDTVAHYSADPDITQFEWKTRGHDGVPNLHTLLLQHGFVAEEPESVMIGEAQALATDVPLPDGVSVRRVTERGDIEAMTRMQASVFGDPETATERVEETMRRLAEPDAAGLELWVAEADGQVVSAGRIDPVPDTEFAGIWGGATLPEWRGRGIYRALTAKRAQAALRAGKRLINSDSTEYSRPILERSGFRRVTTTTPYTWTR
ncbi:GNAT family N-acetyltransferase [Flexivirga oryzae]|uniref:Putative N-acetyltransferase YhbS n=1 Tax=Flexivirga oryzae TaxID=1794944 RepID=A0A839NAL9_9MICO|nr:GNAT family N-acetyltransferase [Flexivirga oryzae]MBB2893034.1 putative N-acetyltransferase YhbS [Flexivirga oryzae]